MTTTLAFLLIVIAFAVAWGIVQLISLPFGGIGNAVSFFWAFMLLLVVIVGLIIFGRRRQKRARAKAAEARANQFKQR